MPDIITLTGIIATDPRLITTGEGLAITSFRLASTQRRFDKTQQQWVDGETNWYTVSTFRKLAAHCANSLKKGERVVLTGRIKLRQWDNGQRSGMNVDIEAEALGHDLSWGDSVFTRAVTSSSEAAAVDAGGGTEEFPSEAALADHTADVQSSQWEPTPF